MIAKHFKLTTDTALSVVLPEAALPAGLVIAPGNYTVNGVTYSCAQEGLVRFWEPMASTQHRIVYAADVEALMSALAWLVVNGRADEAMTVSARTTAALNYKLRLLCGKAVEWAKSICDSVGLQSRICNSLTGGTPTNYYDGHVMLEVKVGAVWRLYDIANDCYFGANLALKDALPLLAAIAINPLADDGYSVEQFVGAVFDVTAWHELTMRTPAQKRSEMERVLQIPGITHTDGLVYFYLPAGMESRSSYVTGLSAGYRVITQAAWLTQFYP